MLRTIDSLKVHNWWFSSLKNYLVIFIVCVNVLPTCVYVFRVCAWWSQRPEEGTGPLGAGVTDGCELPMSTPSNQCSQLLRRLSGHLSDFLISAAFQPSGPSTGNRFHLPYLKNPNILYASPPNSPKSPALSSHQSTLSFICVLFSVFVYMSLLSSLPLSLCV